MPRCSMCMRISAKAHIPRASNEVVDLVRSDDMTLQDAKTLVVKVMSKSLDSTNLSAEKRKLTL